MPNVAINAGASRHNHPMNPRRVILWMTIGVAVVLLMMTVILLGAIPPWPVWLFFAISHGFFCAVVWKVKPYPGPFAQPLTESETMSGASHSPHPKKDV